jgi:hypothetical protein
MSTIRNLAVLASVALLGACNAAPADLRADPGQKGMFHVDVPFDLAYENFRTLASECWERKYSTTDFYVNVTKKTDKTATVEIIWEQEFRTLTVLSADITAGNAGTDVTYFLDDKRLVFKDGQMSLTEWARGHINDCGQPGGMSFSLPHIDLDLGGLGL